MGDNTFYLFLSFVCERVLAKEPKNVRADIMRRVFLHARTQDIVKK